MTYTIMSKDTPILLITKTNPVTITSKVLNPLDAFLRIKLDKLLPDKISIKNFENFLESRCPNKSREDLDYILKWLKLRSYNPYWICRKTHAVSMSDFIWIKYEDEDITYDDVRLR